MRGRLGPRIVAGTLLVLVAIAAVGCGSGKASPKAAYAKQLSSACTAMQKQIAALGKPSDLPIKKLYPPSVKIGHAFVKQIKAIVPPASERTTAKALVQQYGFYFDGIALGYAVLVKRESQQGFIQTIQGADANLKLAEGYARKLGAPACAQGPLG
jgi:hypothetical protein